MDTPVTAIPSHIPESLVYDFDFFLAPELSHEPHQSVSKRLHQEAPEIFYTPRYGGHWIVARAAAAVDMFRHPELFSSRSEFNAARRFVPPMLPNQADPPDHTEYRRVINPYLSPGAVGKRDEEIRALARQIIDEIHPKGKCEFVIDVAQRFPVTIFLRLVGAPVEDRHKLVRFAEGYTRSPEFGDRVTAIKGLSDYLKASFEERRKQPGDDLLSHLLAAKFNDRPLTQDEAEGLATLMFLGGLDTVKSVLSFVIMYLATHPEQYRRLVEDRDLIGHTLEELLRVHGGSVPERGATHDFDYRGVPFRQNDRIVFLTQIYGLDGELTPDPYTIDFNREISQHLTFGSGPHRCVGSHLARLEIRIFLEEWTKTFRSFHVENHKPVETVGGIVWTPIALPLEWPLEQPSERGIAP